VKTKYRASGVVSECTNVPNKPCGNDVQMQFEQLYEEL